MAKLANEAENVVSEEEGEDAELRDSGLGGGELISDLKDEVKDEVKEFLRQT